MPFPGLLSLSNFLVSWVANFCGIHGIGGGGVQNQSSRAYIQRLLSFTS